MINLQFNDIAANKHFLATKEIIKSRIRKILSKGIKLNRTRISPYGSPRTYLNSLLNDNDLKALIMARPDNLEGIISGLRQYCPDFVDETSYAHKILYNIFVSSCYEKSDKFSKHQFITYLNRDTCPYCNRSYIYYLSKKKGIKPQIDHFFPKSKYPFLAMSFYNLIPSCQTCNGFGAKEEKDPLIEGLINPYLIKPSDFLFTYEPTSVKFISSVLDKTSIKLKIKKNIPGHLTVFKLAELYEQHADHVIELVVKSKIGYSKSYRNYLKSTTKGDCTSVKMKLTE